VWYSKKAEGTLDYFREIALHRYNIQYRYIPSIAEFDSWKNKNVLEIGCGVGTDGLQYARNGANYTGVDLTKRAVETAKKHFKLFGVDGKFIQTNAERLPFDDNTFDLVYSFGVLHHTPNFQDAFDEVHRVLKPGGKAIVMLYARGWKHYFFRVFIHGFLLFEFLRFGIQKTYDRNSDGKSLTYIFSKSQIKNIFSNFSNFNLEKFRMGAFFDWGTTFPRWFVKFVYTLKLDKVLGENWVIKVIK